jgi:hypothetical protein
LVADGTGMRFGLGPDAGPDAPARLTLTLEPNGEALLELESGERDLSAADRVDHIVQIAITFGSYRASHVRLWQATGNRLQPAAS